MFPLRTSWLVPGFQKVCQCQLIQKTTIGHKLDSQIFSNSLSNTNADSSLADKILVASVQLKDKAVIVNQLNKHFISAGSMPDSIYSM